VRVVADIARFHGRSATLMKANPPSPVDAPELAKFAKIGLVAGQDFDASKLKADFAKRIPQVGFDRIMLQFKVNKVIKSENGWVFDTQGGVYGINYLNRALTTAIGLGANRTKDAVYPFGQKDARGDAYDGANKYVMHFPPGELPPVDGFWSLTMYDKDFFFVANPINRYSLAPARTSYRTPMVRQTFTSRKIVRVRGRRLTGCQRHPANSN
jgi:hypothetical protein